MATSVNCLTADGKICMLLARLSRDSDLPVSASFLRNTANARDPPVLHAHLESLLIREPGIFLERYGKVLSMQELQPFEDLSDTTVQHYVRQYTGVIKSPATLGASKAVKNRRFAMMKKLDGGGSYFSMESMRQRDPILYHEYVGQLPLIGMEGGPDGPAEPCKLSERIMRQYEGLEQARCLQAATLRQEQALGVPAQHSTHDHLLGNAYTNQHLQDTDSGHAAREVAPLQTVFPGSEGGAAVRDDDASPRGDAESAQHPEGGQKHGAMRVQVATFETLMRERFLGGGDADFVDYSEIDNDPSLDDFWAREEALDAQEKYFDDLG